MKDLSEKKKKRRDRSAYGIFAPIFPRSQTTKIPGTDKDGDHDADCDHDADDAPAAVAGTAAPSAVPGPAAAGGGGVGMASSRDPLSMRDFDKFLYELTNEREKQSLPVPSRKTR